MVNYRIAFWSAIATNVVLIAVGATLWWYFEHTRPASKPQGTMMPANGSFAVREKAETPLVPVQLSPQRLQSIGVRTGVVKRRSVTDEIRTTGNVAVDETRLSYVQVRFSGYIQKVFADATYQYVRKGQPLFTVYSPELVAAEREYLVAKESQARMASAADPNVSADSLSLVEAAASRLKQWAIPPREIAAIESSGQVQDSLEIDSPVSGYVLEREALPNKYVQPDTRLYTVADLSRVWVFAQAFQSDLGRLKAGAVAHLTVNTYPGHTFEGRVDFIYPDLDMTTRTARVRLAFDNPVLALKPGMFTNVVLEVPMGEQLVIPASAVLQSGTHAVAFVDHGDGNLEPRDLTLGGRAADNLIVSQGLKEGERVITSGNFLVDSESELQAAAGAFEPPVQGTGTISDANPPRAKLDLSTEPNPLHKGTNLVRLKLTDPNGAPVSGARVTATLFMAAMPAMGMAAMRVPVTLADQGEGRYEGAAQLDNGGTWQVTILAMKDGQVVANQQLSLNATGGM
jgi:Cu(I)/Ag(I) efflux system membrane fusion protein/cobalt-zinc-cadmium efflux system membrane fusion protein